MQTPTTCQFPKLPRTVKTYKNARSAKLAVTKAHKAYRIAVYNRCTDEAHQPEVLGSAAYTILHARIHEYIAETWANLERTVAAANEQGFKTFNPTT